MKPARKTFQKCEGPKLLVLCISCMYANYKNTFLTNLANQWPYHAHQPGPVVVRRTLLHDATHEERSRLVEQTELHEWLAMIFPLCVCKRSSKQSAWRISSLTLIDFGEMGCQHRSQRVSKDISSHIPSGPLQICTRRVCQTTGVQSIRYSPQTVNPSTAP